MVNFSCNDGPVFRPVLSAAPATPLAPPVPPYPHRHRPGRGRLRFTGGFTDADSVLSWVLTFGDKAELLEPEELRKQLRKLTETLADRYRRN